MIYAVSFHSHLKTLWKRGQLPSVKYGIYGGKLTKANVTDEHLKPKSLGGSNSQGNIALAVDVLNHKRSSNPIEDYLTYEMLQNYCFQFKGVRCNGFNGDEYVRKIKKTIKELIDE